MPTTTITSKATDASSLSELRQNWQANLTGPQDGMWEVFRNSADHWAFVANNVVVGYACANDEYGLIQFYLSRAWEYARVKTLQDFLRRQGITKGMVGTNNPVFFSAAKELAQSVELDTYLFTDQAEVRLDEKAGTLVEAGKQDLERLVNFYDLSIGAPESWSRGYLGNHLQRGEIFYLTQNGTIIGVCEVRKSDSNTEVADIGMLVSPAFRRQGYGTFLLGKAKAIAKGWGRAPICSCEVANIGSAKSIRKNGFRSTHELFRVVF